MPDLFTDNEYVEHPEKQPELSFPENQDTSYERWHQWVLITVLSLVCGVAILVVLGTALTANSSSNFSLHIAALPLEIAGGAILAVAVLAKIRSRFSAVMLAVAAAVAVGFLVHPVGATQVTRTLTVCKHVLLSSQQQAASTSPGSSSTTILNNPPAATEYRIITSSGEFRLDNPVIDPIKGFAIAPTPSAKAYLLITDHATYKATFWGVRGPVVFDKLVIDHRVPGIHELERVPTVDQIQLLLCGQSPKIA